MVDRIFIGGVYCAILRYVCFATRRDAQNASRVGLSWKSIRSAAASEKCGSRITVGKILPFFHTRSIGRADDSLRRKRSILLRPRARIYSRTRNILFCPSPSLRAPGEARSARGGEFLANNFRLIREDVAVARGPRRTNEAKNQPRVDFAE